LDSSFSKQFCLFMWLLFIFFNKQKWDIILTTMIHPAQGVQGANHPRVYTRSRCTKQGSTAKTKRITVGHSYKVEGVATNHNNYC